MQNILKNIEGLGINLEDLKPKKKQITSIESYKQQVPVSCKLKAFYSRLNLFFCSL